MVVGLLWTGGLSDRSLVFVDCKDATLDSNEVFGVDLFEGVPLQLWCKLIGSVVDGDNTSSSREELDKVGISGIDWRLGLVRRLGLWTIVGFPNVLDILCDN